MPSKKHNYLKGLEAKGPFFDIDKVGSKRAFQLKTKFRASWLKDYL